MIIHSGSNGDDRVAKDLQTALMQKGVPSSAYAHNAPDSRSIWPDDTLFGHFNDDLGIGTFFRFLVGGPDQNPLTSNLLAQFSDLPRQQVLEHIEKSRPVFAFDNNVPFGYAPVPTLIIAGCNINATQTLLEETARQIREEGSLTLSRSQYLPTEGIKKPAWAAAILHAGVAVSRVENDTWTHFFDLRINFGESAGDFAPESTVFKYALYPYSGIRTTSSLPQFAQRYSTPLIATQTDIHSGTQPTASSFLSTDSDHFLITTVHPKIPDAFTPPTKKGRSKPSSFAAMRQKDMGERSGSSLRRPPMESPPPIHSSQRRG